MQQQQEAEKGHQAGQHHSKHILANPSIPAMQLAVILAVKAKAILRTPMWLTTMLTFMQ